MSHLHKILPNSVHHGSATSCVFRSLPLEPSPCMQWLAWWLAWLLAWWLDFCILLLGTWGLCNSWGLAVPTVSGPFWWSSARQVLHVATCIIHKRGLMSPRACCSFARIMSFDRTPCHAGLLVTLVVITIPFLITYLIHNGPFQLLQWRHPCPLTQTQTEAGLLPSLSRGLLSLFSCLSPFPLSLDSPFKKPIDFSFFKKKTLRLFIWLCGVLVVACRIINLPWGI